MAFAMIRRLSSRGCSMTFKIGHTTVSIAFSFSAVLCILLIAFPFSVVMQVLAAILLHELGHLLCGAAYGVYPSRVALSVRGVGITMALDGLPGRERTAIALAGPAVNLALCVPAALFHFHTWMAVNGALAVLNLLPVPGLDGGDVLRIVLGWWTGCARADRACLIVGGVVLFPAASAYFLLLLGGMISRRSLLVFAYLVVLLFADPPDCKLRTTVL